MKFTNANGFKGQVKKIAKERGVPAQQVQQNYLLELVIKGIANSDYKDSFIIKGGYLIGQIIGLDKRTTMDLDVTIKNMDLNRGTIKTIFTDVINRIESPFRFSLVAIESIRPDDEYGGLRLKLSANYEQLKEFVFVDITTDDAVTPREINYSFISSFTEENIDVWAYNIETILAEKLETIISRGVLSTRPRDRYDIFVLYHMNESIIDYDVLKNALHNTSKKRGSETLLAYWRDVLEKLKISSYQQQLWYNYQKRFFYAQSISFDMSVECLYILFEKIGI